MEETRRVKGDQDLDAALSKVRKLIAMAEDPACDPAEAQKMRERADAMMFKYAIKEAMVNQAKPAEERTKPAKITVEVGAFDSDILGYIGQLALDIGVHCRCKVRPYKHYSRETRAYSAAVYGFESDVRYFEFLYTTLRLHMLGVLIPKFDSQLTMEENCYRLHNAGYNWLEMAALQGWKRYPGQPSSTPSHLIRYYNQKLDQEMLSGKLGGMYKRPYERACAAKGEPTVKLAAGTTESFRKDAALGYTDRLRQRLYLIKAAREGQYSGNGALVLRSRFDDVEAMFREDNPDMFPTEEQRKAAAEANKGISVRRTKIRYRSLNEAGYASGVAQANTADLGTGMSTGTHREIQ